MDIDCLDTLASAQASEWQGFLAAARHQHPRQSPLFASSEAALGRKPLYAIGRQDGQIRAVALLSLVPHPLLRGAWSQALCLSGPVCDDAETMRAFLRNLAVHPALARVGSLHVTPYWTGSDARCLDAVLAVDAWRVAEPERFRSTGWVDLARSPEEILAGLSKSARREVRRAERQGVAFRPVADADTATAFLDSLNRLRSSRELPPIDAAAFRAGWKSVYRHHDVGMILAAWQDETFLGGLLVYRGREVVHGRHFTTEPEALRAAGNLRIAPALWLEAMRWAQAKGCRTLDVEGYREPMEGDKKFSLYKYKAEMRPDLVARISERARTLRPLIHVTGNASALARSRIRQLAGTLRLDLSSFRPESQVERERPVSLNLKERQRWLPTARKSFF